MSALPIEELYICDLKWGTPTNITNPLQTSSCYNIVKSDLLKTAVFIRIDTISCNIINWLYRGDKTCNQCEEIHLL